jgi:4-amino-4-deoxy-L-arabinose transferase-like glycosyltransferase
MKTKREHLILILIFFVGLLIRYYLFKNVTFIGTDAVLYGRLGKNFIETGNYVFGENFNYGILYPPVYPILIGLINLIMNDLFISGKLISLVSSLVTIFLFYLLGKNLHSKEAGLFAAACYSVYPHIINTSVSVISESLFFLHLSFSIYLFILSMRKNNFLLFVLFAIFAAITYLTRPEGFLLIILPFLLIKKKNLQKDLLKIFIGLIVFGLVACPYLLFLKNATGKFMLSGKSGLNIILGEKVIGKDYEKIAWSLNAEKNQINSYAQNTRINLIGYISKDISRFMKRYFTNMVKQIIIIAILIIPIMFPLFCFFFSKDVFKKNRVLVVLALFTFLLFITYPLFFITSRFIYPIVLILILFSSIGFANPPMAVINFPNFWRRNQNQGSLFKKTTFKRLSILILISSSAVYLIYSSYGHKPEVPVEHIKAGIFLKSLSQEYEALNVMSRKPWVSFYSDARCTSLPYAQSADVIHFARLYDVDYIVVDERLLKKWEVYEDFRQMEKHYSDIELVYEDNSDKRIKLLRLVK